MPRHQPGYATCHVTVSWTAHTRRGREPYSCLFCFVSHIHRAKMRLRVWMASGLRQKMGARIASSTKVPKRVHVSVCFGGLSCSLSFAPLPPGCHRAAAQPDDMAHACASERFGADDFWQRQLDTGAKGVLITEVWRRDVA